MTKTEDQPPSELRRITLPAVEGPEGNPIPAAPQIRHLSVALAQYLAGGAKGYTKSCDPRGCFQYVTQGRQGTWTRADGSTGVYSACEDMPQTVGQAICGALDLGSLRGIKPATREAYDWLNRSDAWGWRPGDNLGRIKRRAPFAWHSTRSAEHLEPGDAVQVMGRRGPHTLILLDRQIHGGSVEYWDTADYGQVFDPDGPDGPETWDHGGRCYHLTYYPGKGLEGAWDKHLRPLIGYVDMVALVQTMPEHWPALAPPSYDPNAGR